MTYISREAAKDEMCERCSNVLMCTRSDNDCPIKRGLNSIPAADVVEVVRCCECAYHDDESQYHYCRKWRRNCPDDSDFFCKWGKRKDGGQDE